MKSTEQQATIFVTLKKSIVFLAGANYIHFDLNDLESYGMTINAERYSLNSSDTYEAYLSLWEVLSGNVKEDEQEYDDYPDDYDYDDWCEYCGNRGCDLSC